MELTTYRLEETEGVIVLGQALPKEGTNPPATSIISSSLDAKMYTISHLNPVSMARSTIHPFTGILGYAESLALAPLVAVLIPMVAFVQLCQDTGLVGGSQKVIDRNGTVLSNATGSHERTRSLTRTDALMSSSEAERSMDITDRFDGSLHLIVHDVYDPVYDSGTSQSEITSSFGSNSNMMEREGSFTEPDIFDDTKNQIEDTSSDVPCEDGAVSTRVYPTESIHVAEADYESFRVGRPIETEIRLGMDIDHSVERDTETLEQRTSSDEHLVSTRGKQSKKNRKKRLRAKERARETKKSVPGET